MCLSTTNIHITALRKKEPLCLLRSSVAKKVCTEAHPPPVLQEAHGTALGHGTTHQAHDDAILDRCAHREYSYVFMIPDSSGLRVQLIEAIVTLTLMDPHMEGSHPHTLLGQKLLFLTLLK